MAALKILLVLLCLGASVNSLPLENGVVENKKAITNKYRLPDDTVPIHYNVKVNPYMGEHSFTFDGETSIEFEVRKSTTNVVLNSIYLTIDESMTSVETNNGNIVKPIKHDYDLDTEMLHLVFENPFEPGIYTLNFKFEGTFSSNLRGFYNSFYRDELGNKVCMVATHFQTMSARRAFPCWDEPAIKATFNVSIKHFSKYTALSNMPMYAQEIDEIDQKLWSHFETTPIMSTNILAFVVADYVNISNSDGTMRIWTRRDAIGDATYFMEIVEKATEVLTRYLNSTVRVPKMDHVTIPQYSSRATENWGLIVYHDPALLYNNETDRTMVKVMNILTGVHELVHQWFGNLVSPAWWKYHWMSEGMATYLKNYIADKMFKDWRLMETLALDVQMTFLRDSQTQSVNSDYSGSRDMRNRDPFIVYRKSSILLRMLSSIVTEDVFQTGLIKYINKHEYSNVTSDDLWNAMQEALNESTVPRNADVQLKDVMDTWVEQSGYPLVNVSRDYQWGTITIRQEISPSSRDKRNKGWWIPITYATKSEPDFSSTVPTHWLRPSGENLTIENVEDDDWVIVNVQQSGYYRVNYDTTNWRRIAKYLNSDDYLNIHVVNRAQIINDAYHSMMAKQLSPLVFMEITNYLSRETDLIPWLSAFEIFYDLSEYFNHHEGAAILKPHILGLMKKLVETIGYEIQVNKNEFVKLKKPEVLSWACQFGDSMCQSTATAQLVAYVEDPETNKVSPDFEEFVYCHGMAKANQTVWNKFFDLHRDNLSYRTLRYLRCAENPTIIENYLNMTITNDTMVSPFINRVDVFGSLTNSVSSSIDVELNFVTENWDKITSVMPEAKVIIEDLIGKITTTDQFDKLKAFSKARGMNNDSAFHYRQKAVERIERIITKIRSWLENNSSDDSF